MAGCVLRAWGTDFDPEIFLAASTLIACNVFRKGARKSASRIWTTSGFTIDVSKAENSFPQQVCDAIEFIKANSSNLRELQQSVGLEGLSLDFGVYKTSGFVQSHVFTPELIRLAADYSMALELTVYR
jgi:hypothetical protein